MLILMCVPTNPISLVRRLIPLVTTLDVATLTSHRKFGLSDGKSRIPKYQSEAFENFARNEVKYVFNMENQTCFLLFCVVSCYRRNGSCISALNRVMNACKAAKLGES